jgi:hypothetical protein
VITEVVVCAGVAGMVLGLVGGAAATDWSRPNPKFPKWADVLTGGASAVLLLALISLALPENWTELARLGCVFGSTAILILYAGAIRWITVQRRGDKR